MAKKKPKGAIARMKANEDAMWSQIRERFELKGDGARALGREFGVAHTTILRRSTQENWQRNEQSIAAHMATQGVLDHLEQQSPEPVQAGASGASTETSQNQKTSEDKEQTTKRAPAISPGALTHADQQEVVMSAKKIARQQQRQLLEEIGIADTMIAASTGLITRLKKAMETDDPSEMANLLRPFSSAGKMESFSSLMRAAISGLKEGVNLRRRAVGLNPNMGYGQTTNSNGISAEDLPNQVRNLLPKMPMEELLKLRDTSAMLNKRIDLAPPTVIDVDPDLD